VLSLCSQQCGLSWRVIWNKRADYNAAFANFDMEEVAAMDDAAVRGKPHPTRNLAATCAPPSAGCLLRVVLLWDTFPATF